jgi:hypothetical protein
MDSVDCANNERKWHEPSFAMPSTNKNQRKRRTNMNNLTAALPRTSRCTFPKTYTCCICGREFHNYGNNPQPISQKIEDRCCNECNLKHVMPARIARHVMGLPARG